MYSLKTKEQTLASLPRGDDNSDKPLTYSWLKVTNRTKSSTNLPWGDNKGGKSSPYRRLECQFP